MYTQPVKGAIFNPTLFLKMLLTAVSTVIPKEGTTEAQLANKFL
jgi:hypothetical protein